jgi:DNA repair exonuclease SbcCD nuclease subunit
MYKKIVHTADWHLEPYKNHDKFKRAIDGFLTSLDTELKDFAPEEVFVTIVGDLFDNRTKEPSNEAFLIMVDTLKRISEKYKTLIVIGNHDYDIHNKAKMDCITPIIDTFQMLGWNKPEERIMFLKRTCIIVEKNLVFCNYSNFEGNKRPPIEQVVYSDKTYVGLFHDVLQGAVTFNSYDFTVHQDNPQTTDIFDGCDMVLLGDIHKHQTIKYKVPVAYSGSLFQLNYGESVDGHGYLIWDIPTKTFEFKEISSNFGLYKVEIDSYEDAISGKFKFLNK